MHKTLLAAFVGATVLAAPAFAQVIPGSAGQATAQGSARAGVTTPATRTHADADADASTTATDSSGTQPLGLGGLLKQTQAADPASDGAGPTGGLNAKARARAGRHGH